MKKKFITKSFKPTKIKYYQKIPKLQKKIQKTSFLFFNKFTFFF